eukprot:gb/GECG01000436.1/.p1 GENE.gb/GECG01000436.1/~~gb/GECG01000436.1/.p1  ORF type:complete len:575 (+),score=38.02 gb/GECG01000436.1/:1-1725(+)
MQRRTSTKTMYPSQEEACHSSGMSAKCKGGNTDRKDAPRGGKWTMSDERSTEPEVGFSKDNIYFDSFAIKCMIQVYTFFATLWVFSLHSIRFIRQHSLKEFFVSFVWRPLLAWIWMYRHSFWKTAKVTSGFVCAVLFHTKCVAIAYRRGVIDHEMIGTQRLPDLGQEFFPDLQRYRWIPEVLYLLPLVGYLGCMFYYRNERLLGGLRVFLTSHGTLLTLRALSFVGTTLPDSSMVCHKGGLHIGSCHDLIFSGHATFVMLTVFCQWLVFRDVTAKWILWLEAVLVIVTDALIVASRNHYTVDVVISLYATPLVFWIWNTHPYLRKIIFLEPGLLPREDIAVFSEKNSNLIWLFGETKEATPTASEAKVASQDDTDGDDASDPRPLPSVSVQKKSASSRSAERPLRTDVQVQLPREAIASSRWRAATDSRCDYGSSGSIDELSNFWDNWNGSLDRQDSGTRPSFASGDTDDCNAPSSPSTESSQEQRQGSASFAMRFFGESTRKWATEMGKSISKRLPGAQMANIHILINNYFANSILDSSEDGPEKELNGLKTRRGYHMRRRRTRSLPPYGFNS